MKCSYAALNEMSETTLGVRNQSVCELYIGLFVLQVCLTLALMIDLFGTDNFVDDALEKVVLSCHPGWKTGDVQLPVTDGVIQRKPGVHTRWRATHHREGERQGGVEKGPAIKKDKRGKKEKKERTKSEGWRWAECEADDKREWGRKGREKRGKTKTVMQIPWQKTKAILLAHSDQGWVIKETQRERVQFKRDMPTPLWALTRQAWRDVS